MFRDFKATIVALTILSSPLSYAGGAMENNSRSTDDSTSSIYMGLSVGSVKTTDGYRERLADDSDYNGFTYDGADSSSLQGLLVGINTNYLSAYGLVLGGEFYLENRDVNFKELDRQNGTPNALFETATKSKYSASLSARLGYPITSSILIYTSLGRTVSDMERIYYNIASSATDVRADTLYGWTKAFGMEYKMSNSMSARIEHSKTNYHDDYYTASVYSGLIQKAVNVQDESLKFSLIFGF